MSYGDMMTASEQGDRLLSDGIRDYLRALEALDEFRHCVEDEFRQAVQKHCDSLNSSLNLQIAPDAMLPYEAVSTGWAGIGVRIPITVGGCKQHAYYLDWSRGNGRIDVCIVALLELSDRSTAQAVLSALKNTRYRAGPPEFSWEAKRSTVLLWRELKFDSVEQFRRLIEELIGEWCARWRAAGGLQKLLRT